MSITSILCCVFSGQASDNVAGIGCSADGRRVVAVRAIGTLLRSDDGGLTWQTNDTARFAGIGFTCIACSADGQRLVSGTYGMLLTSTNSGDTWTTNAVPADNWTAVACSPDGLHMIAASWSRILKSADGGTTWTTNTLPAGRWNAVSISADGTRLVVAANGTFVSGGVFTSTNSGINWNLKDLPRNYEWRSVTCSADGTRMAAGSFANGIFLSDNSGETWFKVTNGPVGGTVKCSADGSRLNVAYPSHLYHSENFGMTWIDAMPTNFVSRPVLSSSADANRVYMETSGDGYVYVSITQFAVNPKLKIGVASGSTSALSWTVPSSNFIVEQTQELIPNSWTNLGLTPKVVDYEYRVELPSNSFPSTSHQYFRLRSVP